MFRILFPMNFFYRDAAEKDAGGVIEEVTKAVKELKTDAQKGQEAVKKQIGDLDEKVAGSVKAVSDEVTTVKTAVEEVQTQIKEIKAAKGRRGSEIEVVPFNTHLADALKDNFENLKTHKQGSDMRITLKAVGDMSYAANFAGDSGTVLTTEYRRAILPLAQEEFWLRNIIPSGTTNANGVWYPRHVGGEGAPGPWTYGTGGGGANESKPLIDYDFDAVNAPVQWIAGIVRIPRQMLDDLEFMTSFLQQNLLRDLYRAENRGILNGTGVTPQIQGLLPIAEAYDGTYDVAVERIVDAAYGQIVENHHVPSHVVLHPRDAVMIALTKASGSGEYDLPQGTVGYVNGRLTIAGLAVVTTTEIERGTFLVGDMRAAQFITRMNPEIRFFEQNRDDVEKNMITVRVEERALLAIYYTAGFVKGSLSDAPEA